MRVAFLVSGRGSNLEAVLAAVAAGRAAGITPVLVGCNRQGVRALDVAAHFGVPSFTFARAGFATADERDGAIGQAMAQAGAELVLLAGYDQLLRSSYFEAFGGRTINIHPSLLPRHGGKGMVGMAVHRSVLSAGDPGTGVTIHEVTADLDAGPIVAQCRVPVLPGDDADALAERVLAEEHRLLVETLCGLAAKSRAPATVWQGQRSLSVHS